MYTFEILTEDEYKAFQEKHEYANFLNSIEAASVRKHEGWQVEYVGVKEDGRVVAATILASIPMMKVYRFYNAQRGLLVDYGNFELLKFFVEELKQYLKSHKALYLMCNPHIIYETHDNEGKLISEDDKSYIIANMEKAGFIHSGFQKEYNANSEVQWEYSLYLNGMNEEDLLKYIDVKTRYNINKSIKQKVQIRKLQSEDMNIFFDIFKTTADRKGFDYLLRDDAHYLNMLDLYGDHICIYFAYLNPSETLNQATTEKGLLEKEIEEIDAVPEDKRSKSLLNKKKSMQIELEAKEKIIEEMNVLREEYGEEIPLSTAMFIDYPYEIAYMYSGSVEDKRLKKYCGPYAIQWETLKYAIEHDIDHYNFYGITGNFDDENDGVFEYKKGFNGVAEKMIGEFILPINKAAYSLYKKIK